MSAKAPADRAHPQLDVAFDPDADKVEAWVGKEDRELDRDVVDVDDLEDEAVSVDVDL